MSIRIIEAVQKLDIAQPPEAIHSQLKRGDNIHTHWTYHATEPGQPPHRAMKCFVMRVAS